MLNFVFCVPTKIYFGKTKLSALSVELKARAKKILIVTGCGSVKVNGVFSKVLEEVKKAGIDWVELSGVVPNPRVEKVYEGIKLCSDEECDFVLAVGGGSVIDTAKAIAAGVKCEGDVWDFFENHTGPKDALPIGTVLTVAATGSEMNGNTVITRFNSNDKRSTNSPVLIPVFSILNPEFTFTVNKFHTACGVADIMSHVFESYFAPIPHSAVQDYFCEGILKTCLDYGQLVIDEPENYDARANIMWASTMALNGVAKLGKISDFIGHAIEHELSGLYDISHGAGLAIIFPNLMKVLVNSETFPNFVSYAKNVWGLTGDDKVIVSESIEKTRCFFNTLGLPSCLSEINIDSRDFACIADNAYKRRGKIGHYKQLSKADILRVLELSH